MLANNFKFIIIIFFPVTMLNHNIANFFKKSNIFHKNSLFPIKNILYQTLIYYIKKTHF